jgi:RNA-directed DNA polymerase
VSSSSVENEQVVAELARILGVDGADFARLVLGTPDRYHCFEIEQDGHRRPIENPIEFLKLVQRRIVYRILRTRPFDDVLHGSVPGRSARTNAAAHLCRPCVVTMDVRRFYPHVTIRHVYRVWTEQYGLRPEIARLLTQLTTFEGHLPTGAPSSGDLANRALAGVDRRLRTESGDLRLGLSRYLDDIAFSGRRARSLIVQVVRALREEGFTLSRSKLRVMASGRAQVVTGLTVNRRSGPSVSRQEQNKIRAAARALAHGSLTGGKLRHEQRSVAGRINYLAHTNPGAAARLRRLLEVSRPFDRSTG